MCFLSTVLTDFDNNYVYSAVNYNIVQGIYNIILKYYKAR